MENTLQTKQSLLEAQILLKCYDHMKADFSVKEILDLGYTIEEVKEAIKNIKGFIFKSEN